MEVDSPFTNASPKRLASYKDRGLEFEPVWSIGSARAGVSVRGAWASSKGVWEVALATRSNSRGSDQDPVMASCADRKHCDDQDCQEASYSAQSPQRRKQRRSEGCLVRLSGNRRNTGPMRRGREETSSRKRDAGLIRSRVEALTTGAGSGRSFGAIQGCFGDDRKSNVMATKSGKMPS
ncbi:hypothetical protein CSUB01_06528 [Colletotrichum sublineola]|uniref:Uncharacterized protein n=1 Tax=Colletotrichum sublineola TaxID=1173701 RepID=A0A066X4Y6_COLSU|nr:hypothetical protein CSUB01_06528 [Colletotrichum sublineola]